MTLPLRQRRRQETAREIQKATLELADQNGLESVTTEEIAAAAGVSTRTFFNYFANKEAAAIGHPPGFSEDDKTRLRQSTSALSADLKSLLDHRIDALATNELTLRRVGKILRSNQKARGILDEFLTKERIELTEVLFERVGDRQAAAALATFVTDAVGRAIFLWEHEEDVTLRAALDKVWQGQLDASRRLLASPDT